MLIKAILDDILQRFLTLNKNQQIRNLKVSLDRAHCGPGDRILDFGCGTALFCRAITSYGAKYTGYDIDQGLIAYAKRLYGDELFAHDWKSVCERGPYDVVLANCCFHHISDKDLPGILKRVRDVLCPDKGRLIVVDILSNHKYKFSMSGILMRLERGAHIRDAVSYERILGCQFLVKDVWEQRSDLLSMDNGVIYNQLGVFLCEIRRD